MNTVAALFLHLPLEGGGRRAKPGGWGYLHICHPTPARRKCVAPTLPLQGRVKKRALRAVE
jgi:hypothetical protein